MIMTREFKLKVLNRWFNKNKQYYEDFGYEGVLIYNGPLRKMLLIKWEFDTYQILTKSHMYSKLLTKTFYKNDESQINNLICTVSC